MRAQGRREELLQKRVWKVLSRKTTAASLADERAAALRQLLHHLSSGSDVEMDADCHQLRQTSPGDPAAIVRSAGTLSGRHTARRRQARFDAFKSSRLQFHSSIVLLPSACPMPPESRRHCRLNAAHARRPAQRCSQSASHRGCLNAISNFPPDSN